MHIKYFFLCLTQDIYLISGNDIYHQYQQALSCRCSQYTLNTVKKCLAFISVEKACLSNMVKAIWYMQVSFLLPWVKGG